jgi:beta-phosphoglucomutase
MIKGVVFDMDGVLVDATEWHYEAFNKAIGLFGYHISYSDHLTSYDGLPTRKKLEMLTAQFGLPLELHDFINEIKQIYTLEIAYTRCKPNFTRESMLAKLKREGIKIGLASNSVRATVDLMMKKSYLDKYLEVVFSNEDIEIPKPNPEIYLKAINSLNLDCSEVLIVEDNDNGIRAAISSGAHVMAINDIQEVNFENVIKKINQINSGGKN